MNSINRDNQADVIEAFNSTSRYLDDLLNTLAILILKAVNQIYPSELQLNKANTTDTEKGTSRQSPLLRFPSFYCKWVCFF